MRHRSINLFALSGAACMLASFAPAVRADVTIVSTTTTSGTGAGMMSGAARQAGSPPAKPVTMAQKTYYKGRKMRTELQGTVALFDGATGSSYILDPAKKTYYSLGAMTASASPFLSMMKMNTSATVKPTGAVKTIAGHSAREYAYTTNIDMTMDPSAMASMGGAPPKPGTKPAGPQHIGTVHAEGSWWVTNIASLPQGGNGAVKSASSQMAAMLPGMKPLIDKLGSIPGIPLASHESTTMQFAMMGGGQRPPSVRSSDATSVSESPLPDSLFTIPPGYKQVDPMAGMGMRPGGRRPGMSPTP